MSVLGTDATIAEHIKKICDREYVIKDGMHFIPSQLGAGIVDGYDKIGSNQSLTKPLLRKRVRIFSLQKKKKINPDINIYETL